MINEFLTSAASATNANGNYSVTPGSFRITAGEEQEYLIERMIVSVEDTSGMIAGGYGDIGSALTNGIKIYTRNASDTIMEDLTPIPITTNAQWGVYCYDVDIKSWGTTPTNELLLVRWTFSKTGKPIKLREHQSLEVYLNDDLTGLLSHRFLIQGQQSVG